MSGLLAKLKTCGVAGRVSPYEKEGDRVILEVVVMFADQVVLNVQVVPMSEVPSAEQGFLENQEEPVILIVDDERVIANTLSDIFRRAGFKVLTAYDGSSALALIGSSIPDILLSDVAMPGMSGIELAMAVAETIPECKTLLFSGHAEAIEQVIDACECGYDFHFVAKPVDPALMVDMASKLVGRGGSLPTIRSSVGAVFWPPELPRGRRGGFDKVVFSPSRGR
jgi:CheY-like chemotaxis protein